MLSYNDLLTGHCPPASLSAAQVREANARLGAPTFIVLDDDPTGTQSVANLPVLTSWKPEDLAWALETHAPAIYVMTNSRSLAPEAAEVVNREVVSATYAALAAVGEREVAFVSRSDSTLRGHFPLEPRVLAEEVRAHSPLAGREEEEIDGIILVPAFPDAGRITVDGVHYAGSKEVGFTPCGESEFARDATFGYRSSHLAEWVEEKTAGAVSSSSVISVRLDDLRANLETVRAQLRGAHSHIPIVVDAVEESDMRALALALADVEAEGKRFLYRVGPPFVRARIGQEPSAPVSEEELSQILSAPSGSITHEVTGQVQGRGGLIVVGSHVGLTTRQLAKFEETDHPIRVELDVAKVVATAGSEDEEMTPALAGYLSHVAGEIAGALVSTHVVVSTSRTLVTGRDAEDSLRIARLVSTALVQVVREAVLSVRPGFVVAKGGITSSDIASKALGIGKARVVGPMLPGIVSMWQARDGIAKGVPYIVFAGNVGNEESLREVVARLNAHLV